MSGSTFRYETPSAFRTALKERFGQIARVDRRYRLDELQRQFAYDRTLARLFRSDDADRWVLKGAGALLARLATARHSKDVDVFFDATDADVNDAVDALRAALRIDLGDHFAFDVTRVAPLHEEAKGARVHVNARLGPTSFAGFHIDVVVGTVMTGTPDVVAPLTPLNIEGLVRPNYRVFPIADHMADKLCATIGTYARDGQPASSSRVKDLVDIAIIAITHAFSAEALRTAVVSNAAMRKIELPERFVVPDTIGWGARYPRIAAEAPGTVPDYDTAISLASQIFDPVLDATAIGVWDPSARAWSPQ
ncbi:nucleotidyl transferase AbiEii/AbiGii toxin family protein [Micromonospora eburnea]|uniref:Nucleotidyl transferase AbiEii toxin, Type IV TA system n=1 Tax=Micromonospora eburnea TaxID=227316 RepID=A0A1C6TQT9_9ACTN|nr:nucleotidyl transferase AbiEii/AbiGii toxin family protein [Micromonospora eburnea]SCL44137.1 Nucleotidyl transferase AbiEii toxin, Type IV TA system [Micromonospora eburnea]